MGGFSEGGAAWEVVSCELADGTARAKCVGVPSTSSGQALRRVQDELRSLPA